MNDLVKNRIKIQRPFSVVATEVFKLLEETIEKAQNNCKFEKKMVENYYCFNELKYLRLILCEVVFK